MNDCVQSVLPEIPAVCYASSFLWIGMKCPCIFLDLAKEQGPIENWQMRRYRVNRKAFLVFSRLPIIVITKV